MTTFYRVGHLEDRQDDDAQYDDLDTAVEAAAVASIDDSVWGVWDLDTGDLVAVAYQQKSFSE